MAKRLRDVMAARSARNWKAYAVALFVLLAVLPGIVVGRSNADWLPEPVEQWAFDVRIGLAPQGKKLASLAHGSVGDRRVYMEQPGQTVSFESDGLTIVGSLSSQGQDKPRPAVLLLHGSTPEGRKMGLYPLLASELANSGYVVLSIDQRGFGDSDDPTPVDLASSFDYVRDVENAISYLSGLAGVNAERLYVVGHSFGADVAITAGIDDPRIRRIVAIGPGRGFVERAGSENAPEVDYFRQRLTRYMGLSQIIPAGVFLQFRATLHIENHIGHFQGDHKPLLLIDGEAESLEDRQILEEVYQSISEPKRYVTLPDADHYANTANFGPLVIYDQRAIERLSHEIDEWLSGS